MYATSFTKPDHRVWIQFSHTEQKHSFEVLNPGLLRPKDWKKPTLRYNPMREEYVAYSTSRQNRPQLPPANFCPLCPMKHEVQDFVSEVPFTNYSFDVAAFENIFPALSMKEEGDLGPTGHCEVILFSPDHNERFGNLPLAKIEGIIAVWQHRSKELGALEQIKHVYLFENKGEEIGVTLHHPHGQLYAFTHTPPFIEKERKAARGFFDANHTCLFCEHVAQEANDKRRIIVETDSILAYIPETARYPYEVHITSKSHRALIEQLSKQEVKDLAYVLKQVIYKYNGLFDFEMPYILAHHQANAGEYDNEFFHWHIEIYPPYRSANKLKYLAGVESGVGFFVNDTLPEEKAKELQNIEVPF